MSTLRIMGTGVALPNAAVRPLEEECASIRSVAACQQCSVRLADSLARLGCLGRLGCVGRTFGS